MKQQLLILLLAALIAPTGLMAQKVYMEGGKIILDSRGGEGIGLPTGAVTATKKYVGVTAPASGTWLLINNTDNLPSGSINATVYQKLEIAPQDLGTNGLGSGAMTMYWTEAFNGCKGMAYDGGNWRLPTQRELTLIWIFMPAIDSLLSTAVFFTSTYWSATESAAHNAWVLYVSYAGLTGSNGKTNFSNRVRCVREL